MNPEVMEARYRSMVVAACEWRAIGLAEPEEMADEVFARLDPDSNHDLHDLYASIDQVVIASYRRYSEQIGVLDRLRGGALLSPSRRLTPADNFLVALSKLRHGDREVIQLRFWDELDDAETAEALRLSVDRVRSRLARAGSRYLAKLSRSHPDLAITDVEDTIRSIKPGSHRRNGPDGPTSAD